MRYAWVLIGAVALLTGCVSAESSSMMGYDFSKIKSVAVAEVWGSDAGPASGQVGDDFIMQLHNKGYAVIERQRVNALLEEKKLQSSDLADNARAAEIGKLTGVDAILVVTVPELGNDIRISARMIDVKDDTVVFVGSGSASTRRGATTVAGAALGAAAGMAVGHDIGRHHYSHHSGATILGGVVGAGAGGAIGYALEPSSERLVRKLVEKMCRKLPARFAPMS